MKKLILTYLTLILTTLGSHAQSAAKLSLDKEDIKIGEQIEVLLEVSFPVTENYTLPPLYDTLVGKIEVSRIKRLTCGFVFDIETWN